MEDVSYLHRAIALTNTLLNRNAPLPVVYNKYKMTKGQTGVYIGRGSPWGNQFIIGRDGNREEVCDKYETFANDPAQVEFRAKVRRELKGKNLICFCEPCRCHGRTLLRIANEIIKMKLYTNLHLSEGAKLALDNKLYVDEPGWSLKFILEALFDNRNNLYITQRNRLSHSIVLYFVDDVPVSIVAYNGEIFSSFTKEEYRRKGYASECLQILIKYFNDYKIKYNKQHGGDINDTGLFWQKNRIEARRSK